MPQIDPPVQIIAEFGSDIRHLLCSIPRGHIGAPWSPALLSHVPGPSLSTIQDQLCYEKNSYLEERSWAPVFNIVSLKYMQYPNIFHPYLLLVFKQMSIAGNCWLRLPQSNLLGQILPSFQQNYCLVLITDYTFLTSEVYFLQNNGKCCHPTICLCIILKNLWISLALPRGQILLTMTWLSDIGTTTVSEYFQVFFGCSLTLPQPPFFQNFPWLLAYLIISPQIILAALRT